MSFNPGTDEQARIEYYTARLFTGQNIHGENKNYNDLKKTYQITILAKGIFFPDEELIHDFSYSDLKTHVSFAGKTRIITVELEKIKPIAEKPVEKMTKTELWAVFFEYLTDSKKRAKIIDITNREEGIALAVKTMTGFTQNELDYMRETARIKSELDYQSLMTNAERKGLQEGLEKGLKEGRKEVFELLEQGLSVDEIKERLRDS